MKELPTSRFLGTQLDLAILVLGLLLLLALVGWVHKKFFWMTLKKSGAAMLKQIAWGLSAVNSARRVVFQAAQM